MFYAFNDEAGAALDISAAQAAFVVYGDEAVFAAALANDSTQIDAWLIDAATALDVSQGSTYSNLYYTTLYAFVKTAQQKVFVVTRTKEVTVATSSDSVATAPKTKRADI